jgi:hypothetical protein
MATQNEIFDDIAARLGAVEFMLRQLFCAYARDNSSDPAETVGMLQATTAEALRSVHDSASTDDDRASLARQSTHIARIYEDVLRALEASDRS